MEEWREIPGTEYSVSSEGRVRSKNKILSPGSNGKGYLNVNIEKRSRKVHQLVAEAFLGPRQTPLHQVNHKNGVGSDNRAANLEWATQSQNQRHRYDVLKHGAARGARNSHAKLSEDDVRVIRSRRASGETRKAIAADFGITPVCVSHIATRRIWAWLE